MGAQSGVDVGASTSGDGLSTSGMLPATFDIAELGEYASAGGAQEVSRYFRRSNLISSLRLPLHDESESISDNPAFRSR